MSPIVDDASDASTVTYPRFDHGVDLFVLFHQDGSVEFQTAIPGQSVTSDTVVHVKDAI